MCDHDMPSLAKELLTEIKNQQHGGTIQLCCGGLTPKESIKVKGWTKEGDLFTPEQQEAIRAFANTLLKGKKYFLIGAAIMALFVFRNALEAAWKFITSLSLSIG